jgi:hypothetical protein
MTTTAHSPFGVPWLSAALFTVVVGVFLTVSLFTFDPDVGLASWLLRVAGTAVWVGFAGYLGYRDIVTNKGGGQGEIDQVPFDRWSWIHAAAGALFGLWLVPFALVAVITIAWEFFEKYVPGFGEKETLANRAVDIVGAWIGWFLLALLISYVEGKGLPIILPAETSWIRS